MGCLNVNITKIGGNIDVDFSDSQSINVQWERPEGIDVQAILTPQADVQFSHIKPNFGVSIGLVCSVGQGAWEYLMCSDKGFVRTYDKGFILVRKK